MAITFRKLTAQDSARYREIRLESLKAHPESFGADYEKQKAMPKLMFQKALEQPCDDRFVFGAFDKDRLIGITAFVPFVLEKKDELADTGSIIQVYVEPAYRGGKVGLNLMTHVVKEAFKQPTIQRIQLGVMLENLSAIRIYQQAGFITLDPEDTSFGAIESGGLKMVQHRQS